MMIPPPHAAFREDLSLLLWKPQGALAEHEVNKILAFIGEEEALSDAAELRFIDTSGLTAVDLNFNYVFHISLYRRLTRTNRPSLKTACFVNDEAFAHYFKLHAMLADHSPLQVRIFHDRAEAAQWLGIPVEALEMS